MSRFIQSIGISVLFLGCLAGGLAFGVGKGEKVKMEGLIVSRHGDSITLRTTDAQEIPLILTDYTEVFIPQGWLGKKQTSSSSLVPGLWIKVQGIGDSTSHVLALKISFSGNDLRTANAIQAGLRPLDAKVQLNEQQTQENRAGIQASQQQIQLNQQHIQTSNQNIQSNRQGVQQLNQRFHELENYDVSYTAFVYFPVGSAALSAQGRSELMQVARNAQKLDKYLLEVRGYTDSVGPAAMNQDLSRRRAESVIDFLQQSGNIPLTRLVTPGAMGASRPVASNETSQGRAENRRAAVRILVDRGLSENYTSAAR